MSETEELAVRVVEASPQREADCTIVSEGWGGTANSPDIEAVDSFLDAMADIREQYETGADTGERIATLVVDRETRHVHEWHIEGENP